MERDEVVGKYWRACIQGAVSLYCISQVKYGTCLKIRDKTQGLLRHLVTAQGLPGAQGSGSTAVCP